MALGSVRSRRRSSFHVVLVLALATAVSFHSPLWDSPWVLPPPMSSGLSKQDKAIIEISLINKLNQEGSQKTERIAQLEWELENSENERKKQMAEMARQDEKSCKMRSEIQDLQSQLVLGATKENKLLQASNTRAMAIFWSLKSAAPALHDEDAREVAGFIDIFEDFSHPDHLRLESTDQDTELWITRGKASPGDTSSSWNLHLRSGYTKLPKAQKKSLRHAVEAEICEHKKLFPMRQIVKEACSTHLGSLRFPSEESLKKWVQKDAKTVSARVEEHELEFFRCFHKVITRLEERKVNVELVLLDSWMPVELIRPLSALGALERARTQVEGRVAREDVGIAERAIEIYRAIKLASAKRLKRIQRLAADALSTPPQGGPAIA